jgi:hypothetical protein
MGAERTSGRLAIPLPRGWEDVAAGGVLAVCAILYVLCASGELWFDEVLSLQWAKNASSVPEILTLYRHDNNHPLNTLWMYLAGEGRTELTYRALSVFSGVVSLLLILALGRRLTPASWWVPFILAASSYAMVLYSSEARGYAPALACSLAAVWLLLRDPLPALHPLRLGAFWLVSVAGILAHATAVYPLIALGVWFLVSGLATGCTRVRLAGAAALWFGVPAMVFLGLFVFFLRPMMVAGGPSYPVVAIAAEFFGYGFGLPVNSAWAMPVALLGVAALGWGLVWGKFEVPSARIFFILVIAVVPMLGLLVAGPEYLHFRYFLVCLPFGFLVLGALAERLPRGLPARVGIAVLLAILVSLQVPRIATLAQLGRGGARPVLERVSSAGAEGQTIISNHDLMLGMVVEFYRARDSRLAGVRYLPQWAERSGPADWLVISSQEQPLPAPSSSMQLPDASYRLVTAIRSAPVSGTHWILYRREGRAR